ncbi:lipid-A-disaccharide synthase [Gloeobacter kilaueensis]|uniref:Lipid-A-disaccharide synthase n=1 Tax=Gloeobacter kilaueensis (strain ATCC BAA-2537 / CCAP 1431/1 / ULC 316 / JS1) TaxID=1183438 RepID=U5QDC2_GLOK1|nr:lipid-A-disaccharide synthase [Gloeobacter kilaueensis]AGY56876.1 lipid-A-disaccharide synthase [Gloeobacter kilaueensis JS1]
MAERLDILLLSNGPGEVNTWVRPVVAELRRRFATARLSLVLAPDGNASGFEEQMAQAIAGIERVQPARDYLKFLVTGRTSGNWDWAKRGVVLFLGGDQGLSALIARRLGYPIVAYAEWQVRWPGWIDRFGLREEAVRARSAKERFKGQFQVTGDLMIDAVRALGEAGQAQVRQKLALGEKSQTIALLPGSKPAKLSLGIPMFLGLAEALGKRRSDLRFVIPVAPALQATDLERYALPTNPNLELVGGQSGRLVRRGDGDYLETAGGVSIRLWFDYPAYDLLSVCDLALTTVGANTAELGILGVPMIVIIPTNRWDVMRAWDGLPGLFSNLPGKLGSTIAAAINRRIAGKLGLLAWPNIRAERMLVPELFCHLTAADLVPLVEEWLADPERRAAVSWQLRQVMGASGAASAFVNLVEAVVAGVR